MANRFKSKKSLFTIAVVIIILLNFYTLSVAYPTMDKPLNLGGADLPRDFSVYYLAAWRLFHNPSQTFTTAPLNDGEPAIYPPITPYKYTPSFLLLVAPLLSLSYYQAFWVFDAIQFALLPLMAFLLYKLLENKNPLIALIVLFAVLLLPYPMVDRGLSVSYFMQWAEGQAKVLLAFLLLGSFYLGYRGKAVLSGIVFALGAFDPRFAVLALPLFLFYNKNKLKPALATMIGAFALVNAMVFYPGVAQGFLDMVSSSGNTTPFYTPSWIPLVMIACLMAVNAKSMINKIRQSVSYAQRNGHSER